MAQRKANRMRAKSKVRIILCCVLYHWAHRTAIFLMPMSHKIHRPTTTTRAKIRQINAKVAHSIPWFCLDSNRCRWCDKLRFFLLPIKMRRTNIPIPNKMFVLNSQFNSIKRLMLLSIYIATEPSSSFSWSENKVWFDVPFVFCSNFSIGSVRFFLFFTLQWHVTSDFSSFSFEWPIFLRLSFVLFLFICVFLWFFYVTFCMHEPISCVRCEQKAIEKLGSENLGLNHQRIRKFFCLLNENGNPTAKIEASHCLCIHIQLNASKNGHLI